MKAVQLFILRGVPEDEADDIRKLLLDNEIDYYETPAGNWGISMPAIWLNDADQLDEARALVEKYQQERYIKARDEYAQLSKQGKDETLIDKIRNDPLRFVIYLAIIAIIVYFSTKPFIDIGK